MKISIKSTYSIVLGGLLAISLPAQAVRIEYGLTALGGNSYVTTIP